MRHAYIILISVFFVTCDSPKDKIDLSGAWTLESEIKQLDGIRVTIPVGIIQSHSDCKYFINFVSESHLMIGDCEPDYTRSFTDSLFIQKETKFPYSYKDSILKFDRRQFKISFKDETKLTMYEETESDSVVHIYKRIFIE